MNTTFHIVATALLAALVPAQSGGSLARAQVIEHNEGDLRGAEQAYRAVLQDAALGAQHGEAALRLGSLLWRLDRKDEAQPLLERAVAVGGEVAAQANAVLQGQDAEGQQAAERLLRARALVERVVAMTMRKVGVVRQASLGATTPNDEGGLNTARRDLRSLGAEAAQAITESLRKKRDDFLEAAKNAPPATQTTAAILATSLWQVGTEAARKFFAEVAVDPSLEWRRSMVQGCREASPDMFETATTFLRDGDPLNEVQDKAAGVAFRLPIATLQRLAGEGAAARAAALQGLAAQWKNLESALRGDLAIEIRAAMAQALTSDEPRLAEASRRLFDALCEHGPDASRTVALTLLPLYVQAGNSLDPNTARALTIGDAELKYVLAAAQAIAGVPPSRNGGDPSGAARTVANIMAWAPARWTKASAATAIDIVDTLPTKSLEGSVQNWLRRFLAVAEDADFVRLVRIVPRLDTNALATIAQADLPEAAFPELTALIDRSLAGSLANEIELGYWASFARRAAPALAAPYFVDLAVREPSQQPAVVYRLSQIPLTAATEQALAGAWTRLLAPDRAHQTWSLLPSIDNPRERVRLPRQTVPALLAVIQDAFATYDPTSVDPNQKSNADRLEKLTGTFGQLTADDVTADSPIRRALDAFFGEANAYAAQTVFVHLPKDVAVQFAAAGHALLQRTPYPSFFVNLTQVGIEVTTDEWWRLLQRGGDWDDRRAVLEAIPSPLPAKLRPQVERIVAGDARPEVRVAACWALARTCGADAVGPLLAVMQDQDEGVRTAAAQALEQLRREREQRAFWSENGFRIDTSPAAAATKLVAEAMPDQPKAQRQLAIRSLAALRATTALPYLIEWAREGDAEIAAAARAAIDSLLGEPAAK